MKKLVQKNKEILVIISLIFLFNFILHCFFELGTADDQSFKLVLDNQTLIEYLKNRYNIWSSRLIIETVLILLLQISPVIWIVADSIMFVVIFYSIVKISKCHNNLIAEIVLAIAISLIPLGIYSSAGWYATTINYVWPLALGLYCLSTMQDLAEGKKKKLSLFVFFPALLFASNQEQMCALLFGFGLLLNIFYIIKNKKINFILLISWLLTISMFIFIVMCPGNKVRSEQEIVNWYPEYADFGFVEKLFLGFFSTVCTISNSPNITGLLFLILITILGLQTKQKKYCLLSFVPWAIEAFLVQCYQANPSRGIGGFMTQYIYYVPSVNLLKCTLVLIVILPSIISTFCIIHRSFAKQDFIVISIILLAAFMSRMIMGFSATIYASLERTFIFMYYLILVVDIIMLQKVLRNSNLETTEIFFG